MVRRRPGRDEWRPSQATLVHGSRDVRIRRLIRRIQLNPGYVLIRRPELNVDLGHRIRAEHLQLREPGLLYTARTERDGRADGSAVVGRGTDEQRLDQWRPVAESPGIGRIDDVAVVERLTSGARSTLEDDAAAQPHVEADVKAVPMIDD